MAVLVTTLVLLLFNKFGFGFGCVTCRRRLTFGGVRRRRYAADHKAELPLIAAYSDMALRTRRLDGQEDTADDSDCTGTGDLRFYYDCKRPLQCSYQVGRSNMNCNMGVRRRTHVRQIN